MNLNLHSPRGQICGSEFSREVFLSPPELRLTGGPKILQDARVIFFLVCTLTQQAFKSCLRANVPLPAGVTPCLQSLLGQCPRAGLGTQPRNCHQTWHSF